MSGRLTATDAFRRGAVLGLVAVALAGCDLETPEVECARRGGAYLRGWHWDGYGSWRCYVPAPTPPTEVAP